MLQEIRKTASGLAGDKKFATLLLDEMSIREDLVYDRRGGDIIGFINPKTWNFKKVSSWIYTCYYNYAS